MLTEHCIYTIRNSSDLEREFANGGRGEYEERRTWASGKRLLDDARRSDRRLPIIFAPAENTRRLFGWALIDEIVLLPDQKTRYSFSEFRLFADRPAKSALKKASDGKRLGQGFIRPYAICLTPSYIDESDSGSARRTARFWACHWQNRLWRDEINAEYQPVCSTGSNMFRKRGVSDGDVAFVVSIADGYLLLGGRMKIKRIVSRREAVRIWGSNHLYDAAEWIIDEAQEGTPLNLHRRLDPALSRKLRFLSPSKEEKGLFFTSGMRLDGQATRGVRELSPASAALLDQIIEITDGLPPPTAMLTVTEDLLRQAIQQDHQPSSIMPEDADAPKLYEEGRVQPSLTNRYERNRNARDECIAHHGTVCSIPGCGFDFRAVYGDAMAGFIHVHHLERLAGVADGYRVDPIKDLRPVCPNCHAVLHRTDPPCSLEEVGRLLQSQRAVAGSGRFSPTISP